MKYKVNKAISPMTRSLEFPVEAKTRGATKLVSAKPTHHE